MVTSHEVAKQAGVSQPTVSRALRGLPGVSNETIKRIRAAATLLGYVPSEAGRALSTRRANRVGIVARELTNPFYPELVEPMRVELDRLGYRTLLIPDSPETPLEVDRLADGTLDGVILTTSRVDSSVPANLAQRGVPFVTTNRTVDNFPADSCSFDNYSGASKAADHLLASGHRKIALIGGLTETSTGRDRQQAFLARLAEADVSLPRKWIRNTSYSYDDGFNEAIAVFSDPPHPTAVFCGNDVIAMGVLNALTHLGQRMRDDVAVIGFDDIRMAAWPVYSLTTLHGGLDSMARESVRLLERRMSDPTAEPAHVSLPVELIKRNSTRSVNPSHT